MDRTQIQRVRRFNRLVTQRVGALQDGYLSRGRPLGEARLIFEIGVDGADASSLRGPISRQHLRESCDYAQAKRDWERGGQCSGIDL